MNDDTTWLIIPVKPFAEAKRRLAAVAGDQERRGLARHLLEHTLSIALTLLPPARVLVVSRDTDALAIASASGAHALAERGRGLNPALRQASAFATSAGAGAVLVVASDLPLLTPSDLAAMTGAGTQLAIAPNRDRSGTNALLMRPAGLIDFAFGRNSFGRHVALAGQAGLAPVVVVRDGLGFDLDLPGDLAELRAIEQDGLALTPTLSPAAG